MVLVLVRQWIARRAATPPHLIGELYHLIYRLPPVEPHDELFDRLGQRGVRFVRTRLAQDSYHHRDHDVRPALTDQRKRAVEVKQYGLESAPRYRGIDQL